MVPEEFQLDEEIGNRATHEKIRAYGEAMGYIQYLERLRLDQGAKIQQDQMTMQENSARIDALMARIEELETAQGSQVSP